MRFISSRTHGVIDYVAGLILALSPWIFGFNHGGAETWVPLILGLLAVVYSLLTDYELGLLRAIPLPAHLGLDLASGVFLALSPWLFGFAEVVWVPHVLFGLFEIGASLVSRTRAYEGRTPNTGR